MYLQVFELLNFLMENFVFTYIGVSTFTFEKHNWDAGFILFAFVSFIVCNRDKQKLELIDSFSRLKLTVMARSLTFTRDSFVHFCKTRKNVGRV